MTLWTCAAWSACWLAPPGIHEAGDAGAEARAYLTQARCDLLLELYTGCSSLVTPGLLGTGAQPTLCCKPARKFREYAFCSPAFCQLLTG